MAGNRRNFLKNLGFGTVGIVAGKEIFNPQPAYAGERIGINTALPTGGYIICYPTENGVMPLQVGKHYLHCETYKEATDSAEQLLQTLTNFGYTSFIPVPVGDVRLPKSIGVEQTKYQEHNQQELTAIISYDDMITSSFEEKYLLKPNTLASQSELEELAKWAAEAKDNKNAKRPPHSTNTAMTMQFYRSKMMDFRRYGMSILTQEIYSQGIPLQILERKNMEDLLNEMSLADIGLVNSQSAGKVGNFLGANYIIFFDSALDNVRTELDKTSGSEKSETIIMFGDLETKIKIVEIESSKIIFEANEISQVRDNADMTMTAALGFGYQYDPRSAYDNIVEAYQKNDVKRRLSDNIRNLVEKLKNKEWK